jgi:hypothetical protein
MYMDIDRESILKAGANAEVKEAIRLRIIAQADEAKAIADIRWKTACKEFDKAKALEPTLSWFHFTHLYNLRLFDEH